MDSDNLRPHSQKTTPLLDFVIPSQGMKSDQHLANELLAWFNTNKRDLPWRKNRDPYRIWISEVMLQQTTVKAVIPFYENFLDRFPKLKDLAAVSEEDLYPYWAGLGYYSRARNLLKAAKQIQSDGFPKKAEALLGLPGFGPYTARAVSSQAFDEKVGVVDGNVIRVLSRHRGIAFEWWKTSEKNKLQAIADSLVKDHPAGEVNQALMELGATICTPKSPSCFLCPWNKSCVALKENRIESLPRPKARKAFEVWLWEPRIKLHKDKIALVENDYAPFLKKQWLFPGEARKLKSPPKDFDFKHSITHHQIYVRMDVVKSSKAEAKYCWVEPKNLSSLNPASLLKKALQKRDLL